MLGEPPAGAVVGAYGQLEARLAAPGQIAMGWKSESGMVAFQPIMT